MEAGDRRSNIESRLVHYPNASQSDRGASTSFVFAPNHYRKLDEATNWVEFDSKIRSTRYHVKKCLELRDRNKTADVVADDGWGKLKPPS